MLKERGFTDKAYVYNVMFVSSLVYINFGLEILKGFLPDMDISNNGTIIAAAFAELGLHTGFIIWKAKAENVRKYPKIQEQIEEADNEQSI